MIVADILSLKGTTLFTVNPDMMLSDAVLTMDEHDIGSVAVMENGKLDVAVRAEDFFSQRPGKITANDGFFLVGAEKAIAERSEERRVGKECRSRWSPYH